ncbi:MAG: MdtA/MuxA family multidrug efflux RND transporter periplasmic adaptor subunit [Caulobacteraceae bacterium]
MADTGTRRNQSPAAPQQGGASPAIAEGGASQPLRADAGGQQRAGAGTSGYQARPQGPGGLGSTVGGSGSGRSSGKLRWLLFALALVAAAVVVWFLIPHGAQAPPQQARGGFRGGGGGGQGGRFGGQPTTVGMATVVRGEVPVYLNALGTVTPVSNVTVRSQIAGQLQSIGFTEGQMVTKGQFMAQVDPRPYQQQLAQTEGVLARDQAQLANARVQLQRYQTLLAQDSIARQDVDTQAAVVRQLEGTIKSDEANVSAQRLNLTYARIIAPVSGRVGLRLVDPGNYVSLGDQNGLVVITQVAPIDVLFTIPEDSLPQVSARVRTGAKLPVAAFDRAQKVELAQGQLLTLDNAVDTTSGTVKAKARFTNGTGTLFPNQFVNVRVLVDTVHDALLVPTSAVLRGSQGLFVYVIQPDKSVTVRIVTTGTTSGDRTAVLSGLEPGDRVVTDGSDRLREGARVILPGDCIPNLATGPANRNGQQGGRGGQGGQGGGFGGGQGGGGFGGGQGGGGFAGGQGGGGQGGGFGAGQRGGQGGFNGQAAGGRRQGGCPAGQVRAEAPTGGGAAAGGSVIRSSPGPQTGDAATPAAGAPGAVAPNGAAAPAGRPQGQGGFNGQPGQQGGAPGGGFQRQAGQGGGQGFGGGAGGGGGGGQMRMLEGLNLDAGQQAKIQAMFAEARQSAASAGDDPQARGQAMRQATQGVMAKIPALLRPDQKAKFEALRAQQQQGGGFGGGGRPGGFGGGQAPQGQ